jgi:hypothetical protein
MSFANSCSKLGEAAAIGACSWSLVKKSECSESEGQANIRLGKTNSNEDPSVSAGAA